MEEDLRALLQEAALTGLHLTPSVEINWVVHPQGAGLPGVVLNRISGAEGYTMSGRDGLTQARVQIDVYAMDVAVAVQLGREIEAALSGYRGPGAAGTFEGIFLTSVRLGREGGTNEAERPFRRSMDLDVNWRAT